MCKWMAVVVGLLLGPVVFAGPQKPRAIPKRIAHVYLDAGKVKCRPQIQRSDRPHYEVTEWSDGGESFPAEVSGPFSMGEGRSYRGPDCSTSGVVFSVTVFNGFQNTKIGPESITHPITILWCPGKSNAPEPKEGVTIYFHHKSLTNAEVAGGGLRNIVGSSRAKANAKTAGPGGTTSSRSEVFAPILGVDADPNAQDATFTLRGLKSGWKGYISATCSAVGSTWIFGSAEAEAFAGITWEAELTRGER